MRCCSHLFEISDVTPKTPNGCEECLKMGDRWVHLRLSQKQKMQMDEHYDYSTRSGYCLSAAG